MLSVPRLAGQDDLTDHFRHPFCLFLSSATSHGFSSTYGTRTTYVGYLRQQCLVINHLMKYFFVKKKVVFEVWKRVICRTY